MPKPNTIHSHGGKQRHSTGAEHATAKSPLPSHKSSRTTVTSKEAGVKSTPPSATAAEKSRKETVPEEAATHRLDKSAALPAARTSSAGHGRPHEPGEPVQPDTALPAAADHPASPSAATAGSHLKVASPKTSGKHGHAEKHHHQHRRTTKPEPAAKSPPAATSPRPTTGTEAPKDPSAADVTTKIHPGGISQMMTSDFIAPECPSFPSSQAIPSSDGVPPIRNVGTLASGELSATNAPAEMPPECRALLPIAGDEEAEGISPITSALVSPLSDASPIPTVGNEVLSGPNATSRFPPDIMAVMHMPGIEAPEDRLPVISVRVSPTDGSSPGPIGAPESPSATKAAAVLHPVDNSQVAKIANGAPEGPLPSSPDAASPIGGPSPIPTTAGEGLSAAIAVSSTQQQASSKDATGQPEYDEPLAAKAPSPRPPDDEELKKCTSSEAFPQRVTALESTGVRVDSPPKFVPADEPHKDENHAPNSDAQTDVSPNSKKPKETLVDAIAGLEQIVETPSQATEVLRDKKMFDPTKAEVVVACLGASAVFSLAYYLVLVPRLHFKDYQLCSTEDCQRHAALLTKGINWTLDPCEDFKAFVCSAWEPSEKHRDMSPSALDDIRFAWYDRFSETLSKGSHKLSSGSKPLAMYEACINNHPYSEPQVTLIHHVLLLLGLRWPEPPQELQPPLGLLVTLSYQWQWPFWITVNVLQPTSSGRRRLLVRQGLALPIMWNHHRFVSRNYIDYWKQFLVLLYPNSTARPSVDEAAVREIAAMEAHVIATLISVVKSSGRRPAAFSFNEIGTHVLNASASEWVDDFQYGMSFNPKLTANDKILAHDLSFLETIGKLMVKYSKRQLNSHLSWLVVQYFGSCLDYSLLVGYTGSKQSAARYLPVFCAFHVEGSFKVLVSALAYFARFSARDRHTIDSGFSSLILAAVERVNSSSWMDDESKLRASQKLSSVRKSLWPAESLLSDDELQMLFADFPGKEPSYAHYWVKTRLAATWVNRTAEYNEALMLPDNIYPYYATYEDFTNSVDVAMGAATAPAFYSNGTRAMMFGGLFFLMAMQIVKAVDHIGIRLAYNGTSYEDAILSDTSMREFNARTECQRGAKNESVFPEVPAVEIAYAAFKESQLGGDDEPLALDEHLPEDRVFFMTLCYLTCARPSYENVVAADCNKIVRNSEMFARVYKCPKGAKMNPKTKCSFFT